MSQEESADKLEFAVRPIDFDDSAQWCFITSSLWQSLGQVTNYFGMLRQAFIHHINSVLANSRKEGLRGVLACDTADPDIFLAYAIALESSLVYTYSKSPYRGNGLATACVLALFPGATELVCPLSTPVGRKLAKHRGVKLVEKDFWVVKP